MPRQDLYLSDDTPPTILVLIKIVGIMGPPRFSRHLCVLPHYLSAKRMAGPTGESMGWTEKNKKRQRGQKVLVVHVMKRKYKGVLK